MCLDGNVARFVVRYLSRSGRHPGRAVEPFPRSGVILDTVLPTPEVTDLLRDAVAYCQIVKEEQKDALRHGHGVLVLYNKYESG